MQQEVKGSACRQFAVIALLPIAEQFALATGEQVVAPAIFRVAPVSGLVNKL
ncbi:hypothetical protein D3C87_1673320 [compost metagenome]